MKVARGELSPRHQAIESPTKSAAAPEKAKAAPAAMAADHFHESPRSVVTEVAVMMVVSHRFSF
jgi:hypothetical protein